jgi:PAS domain-containing protein
VFENRGLRRIFGLKRDEVTGDWRKLHNEELHNLYSSPNIIRMTKSRRMRFGEKRNSYRILVGKPEGKIPLARPRCRWVDNIKIDLRETGWDSMD